MSNPVKFVEAVVQMLFRGGPIRGHFSTLLGGAGMRNDPSRTWEVSV